MYSTPCKAITWSTVGEGPLSPKILLCYMYVCNSMCFLSFRLFSSVQHGYLLRHKSFAIRVLYLHIYSDNS